MALTMVACAMLRNLFAISIWAKMERFIATGAAGRAGAGGAGKDGRLRRRGHGHQGQSQQVPPLLRSVIALELSKFHGASQPSTVCCVECGGRIPWSVVATRCPLSTSFTEVYNVLSISDNLI